MKSDVSKIKQSENLFVRDDLNYLYFSPEKVRHGADKFRGCKYEIYVQLIPDRYNNGIPKFSWITIQNICPNKNPKTIVITAEKIVQKDHYKDKSRFGEFIFLLAAKLKYDLLCEGLDYSKAGFLYSRELERLYKSHTTQVSPSILKTLDRFFKEVDEPIKKSLLFNRGQMWHLICLYGKCHFMYWLNVDVQNIHFVDENKQEISEYKLQTLLMKLFPVKYLIRTKEFREFIGVLQGEKTKRLKAERYAENIIKPEEIGDSDITVRQKEQKISNEQIDYLKRIEQMLMLEKQDKRQDVEIWVWRLFKRIWGDEKAKKHGRRKYGVDVFGNDSGRSGAWVGVQCREAAIGHVLNIEEFRKEIEGAKKFPHSLSKLIIVAIGTQDSQLQQYACQISLEHKKQGLFEVDILTWDEIKRKLWEFPDIWREYIKSIRGTIAYPSDETVYVEDILNEHKTIVGRKQLKEDVKGFIAGRDNGILLITGPPGIGKTALMANLVHELSPLAAGESVISFFFSWEAARYSLQACWRSLYSELAEKSGFLIEPAADKIEILALQFSKLLQKLVVDKQAGEEFRPQRHDNPKSQEKSNKNVVLEADLPKIFIIDAIDEAEDPVLFLRLLPKPLPYKTFFILSSRPGSHLDGFSAFSGMGTPVTIDPYSPENISDANNFLSVQFPKWSKSVIKKITVHAKNNFLFLKSFTKFIHQESIDEKSAADWCEKFGTTEEDPLHALYERYWLYLHDKCLKSAHAEDSEDVNELMGLLAIVYAPVSLPMFSRFLGEKWTTAKFERVFRYIHQFVDVKLDFSETHGTQEKIYRFSHPTFRRFITKKLSSDLPILHGKVVKVYCKTKNGQLDIPKLDNYGLNYIIKHVSLSNDCSHAIALVTPAFLKYKIGQSKLIASGLEDLSILIEVSAKQQDFRSMFKYVVVRETLINSNEQKTIGVEAILRARNGEVETAIADAGLFGDVNDELLVRTELVERYWKQYPQFAMDQLLRIDLLSTTCSSEFSSIKKCISPEVLEATVERIARISPIAAIRLAEAIPEPTSIVDIGTMFENSNYGRAVWSMISAVVQNGTYSIEELANTAENQFHRVFIWMAFGVQMFGKNPATAVSALKEALSCVVTDADKMSLSYIVIRYCLWCLKGMSPKALIECLEALVKLELMQIVRPEFVAVVDGGIEDDPIAWINLVQKLEDGSAKDLINWRLYELGYCSQLELDGFKDEHIKELMCAASIGQLAAAGTVAAANELFDNLSTLLGHTKAVAEVFKIIARYDKARLEMSTELFFKSIVEVEVEEYWAILELLKVNIHWPSKIRRKMIILCSNVARKLKPEIFRSDANLALNKLLAKAVMSSAPNESAFFKEIISDITSETEREVLAKGIIEELSEGFCLSIAQNVADFGLGTTEFDVLNPEEHDIFLPETKASLLSHISWRIGSKNPKRAKDLLFQAAGLCKLIEDGSDREEVLGKVIHVAFCLSPCLALEVIKLCPCSKFYFQWTVTKVLSSLIETVERRMSKWLRFEWEFRVALVLGYPPEALYWKKRAHESGLIDIPPLGFSLHKESVLNHEWLSEIPVFFREYVELFNCEEYDFELRKHAFLIMQLDWPAFIAIVNEPGVGQLVYQQIQLSDLRLAVFKSEFPPARLLEDVRIIASAIKDKSIMPWLSKLKSYLIMAAAFVDPQLCINMVRSLSPDLRCKSMCDLSRLTPKVRWSEICIMELFSLLDASTTTRSDIVITKVRILNWLQDKVEISEKNLNAIADESVKLSDAGSISEIAGYLRTLHSGLWDRLVCIALECAIDNHNARDIVSVLEAHQSLASECLEPLAVAREIDAATEDRSVLYRIAKLQAKIKIDEAIKTLSLMKTDDTDMDDTLDVIAESVANALESEINSWVDRIKALPNLTESHISRFSRAILKQCFNSGISLPDNIFASILDVGDWAQEYLEVYKPCTESEITAFENALTTNMTSSVSDGDPRAFWISGDYFISSRPEKAFHFYRRALQEIPKIFNGSILVYYIDSLAKRCLRLPEEYAIILSDDLYNVARSLHGGKHIIYFADKVGSLICASIAFWPHDQTKADSVLKEAVQEACQQSVSFSLEFPGFEIKQCFGYLVEYYGFNTAATWVHHCIETFPQTYRQGMANSICSKLCEGNSNGDLPLEKFGILQKRLEYIDFMMIKELMPLCSEAIKAMCNFAFAITLWGTIQDHVSHEIDIAVSNIEAISHELRERTIMEIWITYAIVNGLEGVARALCALMRAGLLAKEIDRLLLVAVSCSENGSQFVRDTWEALESAEQYIG
ncbi:MAG: P-loop domain-containing protein [Sedimentisphaerales bacterium]